ncbi:hypothetical protein F4861DRAFT_350321 [Xylaria intraflava]|nr:hypothetical protein F4861DRAFT_350321 [Xylaria intraflava]
MVNDAQPRTQYPSRPSWYPDRIGGDYHPEDGQLAESSEARRPPWTITKGLRELCQIPGDAFFVAAERNGKVICLSTPFGSSQLNHERFFNRKTFLDEVKRIQTADSCQSLDETQLGFSTESNLCVGEPSRTPSRDRRHYHSNMIDDCSDDGMHRAKKRPRACSAQRLIGTRPDHIPMSGLRAKKGIRIGDSDAVYAFYDQRLKCCQQTACKIIAKAWVKAVAPKKQSTNPYTRGDQTRPDWWPKTYCKFGTNVHLEMRHKEPDHLGKEERVYLLCHILRMLVEPPHSQHSAIRKVNLTLDALEAVTFEALSSWFSDKSSPGNLSKRPILKEIFKVARQEERYKDGEIDGDTEILVNSTTGSEAGRGSGSDSDEDGVGLDQKFTTASPILSSTEPTGPPMMIRPVHTSEHRETSHYSGNSFPDTVLMRQEYYAHPGYDHQLSSQRPNYAETASINGPAQNFAHGHLGLPEVYSSPQGAHRRSPVFNTSSDFGSPATSVVYPPWPTSSATTNPPMYGFQQPPSVQAFGGQMAQGPSFPSPVLDGLPR